MPSNTACWKKEMTSLMHVGLVLQLNHTQCTGTMQR